MSDSRIIISLAASAADRRGTTDAAAAVRLRRLVASEFDFVGRVARNLGVHALDVDDVLQQVFASLAGRLADVSAGSERAFLVQAAVRWSANARRSRARRREVGLEALPETADPAPTPEELSDRRRGIEILDRLLATMELHLRTVFVLYEVEEMTMAEVARLLDLPPGTVASRLRRAREEFQSQLDRWRRNVRGEQR
jgi:RNA polymerase sigma-70 factor (ECF subfamily)